MPIFSNREKLHTVKTIYLIEPNERNTNKIVEDLCRDTYDNVFINFVAPVPNDVFERFGKSLAKFNCLFKIRQVLEHAVNFVSLSKDLFSLNSAKSYQLLKSPSLNKQEAILRIAQGLYSACRTLRVTPKIFYPPGISADIVKLVEQHFKDYASSKEFEEEKEENVLQTVTVILLDRDVDLASVLMHPWQYAALLNDLLEIKCNKVEANIDGKSKTCRTLTQLLEYEYDLDPKSDAFWAENLHSPFPLVADEVDKQFNKWKTDYESMTHKKITEDVND